MFIIFCFLYLVGFMYTYMQVTRNGEPYGCVIPIIAATLLSTFWPLSWAFYHYKRTTRHEILDYLRNAVRAVRVFFTDTRVRVKAYSDGSYGPVIDKHCGDSKCCGTRDGGYGPVHGSGDFDGGPPDHEQHGHIDSSAGRSWLRLSGRSSVGKSNEEEQ